MYDETRKTIGKMNHVKSVKREKKTRLYNKVLISGTGTIQYLYNAIAE